MNNKSISIITFHAAHNYGSCLQAYALQTFLKNLDYNVSIIDFRTDNQIEMYKPLTKRKGAKYFIKNLFFILHYKSRKLRYDKFEKYIKDNYILTDRYTSLEELMSCPPEADCYISGSDQIWNTAPYDANMAYFLPFVKYGKKIAYAPSFGQIGKITNENEIKDYLSKYDNISVREQNGRDIVKRLINIDAPILIDPTLLLSRDEWLYMVKDRIINYPYIFFYTLFADKDMISTVKQISKILNLPVIVSNISNQHDALAGFKKRIASGPEDFLNYIYNAEFVCTSSFHGTVFSILFNKQFISLNGNEDKRISTLLKKFNLSDRSINTHGKFSNYDILRKCDFSNIEKIRLQECDKTKKFLIGAIE